jgi:hypothetical protein
VEAKDLGVSLERTEKTEQVEGYRQTLPNLLLTNAVEFRWYVDGAMREKGRLATIGPTKRLTWDAPGAARAEHLLQGFLTYTAQAITQPQALAERLARQAHFLRDRVIEAMEHGQASAPSHALYQAFKEGLMPELTVTDFAEVFVQTLVYGCFAVCYHHPGQVPFQRPDVLQELPTTHPFLRRVFATISGPDLESEPYIDGVHDLAQVLAVTNMEAVLADVGNAIHQEDLVVHWYETFLAAYDRVSDSWQRRAARRSRG